MSYQMVDPQKYVLLARWQFILLLFAVFAVGLLAGGVTIFKIYRKPAIQQINACQEKLDKAERLAKNAQKMAYGALKDNLSIVSRADHVARETMFHSEQLFRRRHLSRKTRSLWADAFFAEALERGIGGDPELGD